MKFFKQKPFTEKSCWDLITKARIKALKKDPNLNVYLDFYLSKLLSRLHKSDLIKFAIFIMKKNKELQTDTLNGVCWLINEVGHGDTFSDFCSWIIYMGSDVFEIATNNPDELVDYVRKSEEGYLLLDDGGPSSVWLLIDELYERNKLTKEEYDLYEQEIDIIRKQPFLETNSWEKHSDLKSMFPKLAEYVIERDGPNCFDD